MTRAIDRERALMERHVEALYTRDAAGRILRVREHDGAPAPRFFLGRTAGGVVCRCRADMDGALCRALAQAAAADPVTFAAEAASDGGAADPARYAQPYVALLAGAAPVSPAAGGPAFSFPPEVVDLPAPEGVPAGEVVRVTGANADVLRPVMPDWLPGIERSAPLFALVVDGRAVSVCASVRVTPYAHEAGVDTRPAALRGRGYAPRVVAAWARAVRALGAEPLYSTGWGNAASRAVARKLGLVLYGTDLNIV